MIGWLMYWHDEKRKLRKQMQGLMESRWQRRNHPAFRHRRTRWSMVRTL